MSRSVALVALIKARTITGLWLKGNVMSNRKMVEGLVFKTRKDGEFFECIDAAGGWPLAYEYVGFEHTDARNAGFCNSSFNDGYWTVVYSKDDYYLWKLSPEAIDRFIAGVLRSSSVSFSRASLYVQDSNGRYSSVANKAKESA